MHNSNNNEFQKFNLNHSSSLLTSTDRACLFLFKELPDYLVDRNTMFVHSAIMSTSTYRRPVLIWLWAGVVMVFVQIILGGITRLTGSGLSITRWEIVTGTVPPLNTMQWEEALELYRQTPQYQKLNYGMSMQEFRFIYFWEYLHRLWARLIGIVFIIPFLMFSIRGWIGKTLMKRLGIAVFLGILVATIGWIMVASGLVDRPWVNAYKLTIHLGLALILFAWLFRIATEDVAGITVNRRLKSLLQVVTILLVIQLLFGGLMSGMRAGLHFPTWPDMYGRFIPTILTDRAEWSLDRFAQYDVYGIAPALVQFVHRILAYLLVVAIVFFYYFTKKHGISRQVMFFGRVLLLVTFTQILLGILTVINCIGGVPLFYGSAHQAVAIILLSVVLYLHRIVRRE